LNHNTLELTNQQRQCVKFDPVGDLLIQGIPGSGKSTILLARAQFLKEKSPKDSILVLTYSRVLSNYVRQLSDKLNTTPLDAKTFHQWGQQLLEETDYPHTRLILGDQRKEAIKFAKNIVNKEKNYNASFPNLKKESQRALLDFLSDEIEWIKGHGITSREEYLGIKRAGRGQDVKVTKENRETIYDILEKYNELLINHYKYQGIDGDDLARIIIQKVNKIPDRLRPDHILIDEAQDLHTMQLKAIKSIAKKSLTIAADKGQQIFRRTFTWKSAGITVIGNRSQLLKQTFRSTKQIVRLANDFQSHDKHYIEDKDFTVANEPDVIGKVPELCICNDLQSEQKHILEHVKTIRSSYPEDTIGIIAQSHDSLDKIKEILDAKGIPVYRVKEDKADILSPGVKLITFQSSKGLEFDHVIITDLRKGKLPFSPIPEGEEEESFISRERKKLYVAMTRAKKTLLLVATKKISSFIDDLNPRYYSLKKK